MAKNKKRIDTEGRQMSLLDVLQKARDLQPTPSEEGSLNISERLRHSYVAGLKQCPLSRWEVAGRMSHLLGVEVSKYMLDAWTAESKNGHRMPAEYIPAFCAATGWTEPVRILTESSGLFSLPGPDALRAEIRRLEEDRRKILAEKKKRELFLQEMESK